MCQSGLRGYICGLIVHNDVVRDALKRVVATLVSQIRQLR